MSEYRSPVRGATFFNCPRCEALAQQEWTEFLVQAADGSLIKAEDESRRAVSRLGSLPTSWTMSLCFACKRGSVWRGTQVVFPTGSSYPNAHPDMAASAAEIYEEARAVGAVSRRAGAALARASLERLLKELRPADSGQLDDRIASLQPDVSLALWQMLTVLRHTGNKALHSSGEEGDVLVAFVLDDEDGQMLGLLLNTINDLVDELVTRPSQAATYFGQLPTGVANTALRKAGLPEVEVGLESSHKPMHDEVNEGEGPLESDPSRRDLPI